MWSKCGQKKLYFAAYAEELFNTPGVWSFILDGEPSLKDRVFSFFKGAPKRYDFAPEMDPAARKWLTEYKKLFDQVAKLNAGASVAENLNSKFGIRNSELDGSNTEKKIVKLGKITDASTGTATKVPDRVIKKIGKIVEDDEKTPLTSTNDKNMQVSGRSAIVKPKFSDYDKPITLSDVEILRSIGRKSVNAFTADEIEISQKWAHKFYNEFGTKSPFFRAWFGEWRSQQNKEPVIMVSEGNNKQYSAGKIKNDDLQVVISWGHDLKSETNNHLVGEKISQYAIYDVQQMLKNAVYFDSEISMPTSKTKMPNTAFMHNLYSLFKTQSGEIHLVKIFVEEALSNNEKTIFKRGYQFKDIKKVANIPNGVLSKNGGLTEDTFTTMYSISDLYDFVKTFDKDFTPASEVNPVLLNEDGTPKVFYHGTGAKFTEFSPDEIADREGSYFFAENREDAAAYGENVHEVYLSARNLANYDDQPREFYQLKSKREQVAWLKERGYDGWYADMDSGGWGEVSVFSPEQIKSATYNIGTFSKFEKDTRYALADGKKVTSTDVARVKGLISEAGIDPRGILGVSDHFFGRYDGSLTRTGLRFEFLEAAQLMLDDSESSFERAYNRIEAIADELVYNEKASGGFADDLKEIQRHIREITFEIRDQDKGEFDSLGGFNEFRKGHFGKLKIGNDGASVDSIYGELQTLYFFCFFGNKNLPPN